jgi:hypothetical protein
MKLYSLYDRSNKPILEKVSISDIGSFLPAGATLVEGNTYNKDGSLKKAKAIYKVNGMTYELIEVES